MFNVDLPKLRLDLVMLTQILSAQKKRKSESISKNCAYKN